MKEYTYYKKAPLIWCFFIVFYFKINYNIYDIVGAAEDNSFDIERSEITNKDTEASAKVTNKDIERSVDNSNDSVASAHS